MPDSIHSRRWILICLCLAAVTGIVYWPARQFGFSNYDDHEYITVNPHVQQGITHQTLVWALTTHHDGNWFPLTWLSHMLDWQLFGIRAGGHHQTNVLIHILNTVLLFLVLRRLTSAPWRSALVAALFAWHPLHVESVAWISERKDLLCALFWILTMGAYGRYAEARKIPGSRSIVLYALTLVLFALGLMAKPMIVTMPFVLLLLDYWPLGRTQWVPAATGQGRPETVSHLVKEKIPFVLLALVSCVITFRVQRGAGAVVALAGLPLGARMANALVSYVRYLGKTIWPTGLAVFYPPELWSWPVVLGAGLLLAVITAVVLRRDRRNPQWAVGWLWYLGTLVPVIGLVQVGTQSMADRYTYLPSIGLFTMLAWSIPNRIIEVKPRRVLMGSAAVAAAVAFAMASRYQLQFWRNGETLFRHALDVTKDNFVAHAGLGHAFFMQNRPTEAMEEYQKALHIRPDYALVLNNMGKLLADQRKFGEASVEFARAVQIAPDYADAHMNLGLALVDLGRTQEALAEYLEALRIEPDNVAAHNNLGNALASQGRYAEAIGEYMTSLQIDPKRADASVNLGIALASLGKPREAIAAYQQALKLDPENAAAHNNLGNALAGQGYLAEAVAEYAAAAKIKPDYVEARVNAGLALTRLGKQPEAIAAFQDALRIDPENAVTHNDLGVVYSHQGKIAEAAKEWEAAVRINPDYLEAHYNLGLALVAGGRPSEGVAEFQKTLLLKPDWPPALQRLAWLLATDDDPAVRNGTEAVRLAERLCEITGNQQANLLAVLAASYAEAGRFPDAVRVAGQAIELAKAGSQQDLVASLQQQLNTYQQNSPFHARMPPP